MSAMKNDLKFSVPDTIAGSFRIRKKELGVRPVVPWHIPLHGRKHTLSIGSKFGPNVLADRLFPQTLEEANTSHVERSRHKALGPRPSSTNFQHISELFPVPRSDH